MSKRPTGVGGARPGSEVAEVHQRVSATTAYSAVVPTPGQEGGWLLFPGPPVLPMKGLSHRGTQSGWHGARPRYDTRKTEGPAFGDGWLHSRC